MGFQQNATKKKKRMWKSTGSNCGGIIETSVIWWVERLPRAEDILYERVEIVIEKSKRVRENDVYYILWIDIEKSEAIVTFNSWQHKRRNLDGPSGPQEAHRQAIREFSYIWPEHSKAINPTFESQTTNFKQSSKRI